MIGSTIDIIVVRKKSPVILVRKGLVDYFVEDLRVLEIVGQFLQEPWRADKLNHLWLSFLFVQDAEVDIEGAKLRKFHGLLDEDFLSLAEGVPASQRVRYGLDLSHINWVVFAAKYMCNIN